MRVSGLKSSHAYDSLILAVRVTEHSTSFVRSSMLLKTISVRADEMTQPMKGLATKPGTHGVEGENCLLELII